MCFAQAHLTKMESEMKSQHEVSQQKMGQLEDKLKTSEKRAEELEKTIQALQESLAEKEGDVDECLDKVRIMYNAKTEILLKNHLLLPSKCEDTLFSFRNLLSACVVFPSVALSSSTSILAYGNGFGVYLRLQICGEFGKLISDRTNNKQPNRITSS